MEIEKDELFIICQSLAKKSQSPSLCFGAVLLLDNVIIGMDRNRRKRLSDPISMGGRLHAEIAAVIDAKEKGYDVRGSVIFVAGFFAQDKRLYVPKIPTYSCGQCPKILIAEGINDIMVPQKEGWYHLTAEEALVCLARDFPRGIKKEVRRKELSL